MDRGVLRRLLIDAFSESELRDLCFDLGVDDEALPGISKPDKVRALIVLCERSGRLSDLIAACRQLRPHLSWPSESQTADTAAPALNERQKLEHTIEALQAQRATLGDAIVDAGLAALRQQVTRLEEAAVHRPSPSGLQRKQVTLLFVDIVDSTRIGQNLDPEDIVEVMNSALQRLAAVVEQHGGYVSRFMGDGFKAVFGGPTAREDDAERAVRAGLAILEAAKAYGSELVARRSIDSFQVRVGANTGLVAMGEGVEGANTIMGTAVNLAARIESAAPPGGLLISHHTFQHVRGIFDVEPLAPILVKGLDNPVLVYLVQRARPRAFRLGRRGVEGIRTRMIGRERELKVLQDAFYTAVDESERQMVTISADAGVGKSRLLDEFVQWLDVLPERVLYFKGRARQEMQTLPYSLLRDLFAFRFQIQESDSVADLWQKMEQGMAEVLGSGDESRLKAHVLGHLSGFDFSDSPFLASILNDAQQLRDRALVYLTDYFRAASLRQPVVILLEDIHWADDSSLNALNQSAQGLPQQRLLIVCAAREELWQRRPFWGKGQLWHILLPLTPLSKRDSQRLVMEILQKVADLPTNLRELIVEKAEGNPYYVEELIKMLITDGVIIKGEEQWSVEPSRLVEVQVPSTLMGILQARLDSLAAEEKVELQRASVVGRLFWDDVVASLVEEDKMESEERKQVLNHLFAALSQKEMVFPREISDFADTKAYIFKHALLREVTYESVLKRLRRTYHALVAEWLITHSGERQSEYTGLIAEHLEQAGKGEQAAVYLLQAGEQAAARFGNTEALNYFSRALALVPESELARRYDIHLAREEVYNLLGEREAQQKDLEALEALAEALHDDLRRVRATLHWAALASQSGNFSDARQRLQQGLEIARRLGDQSAEADILQILGVTATRQADYLTARARLQQGMALAQALNDVKKTARMLANLGIVAWYQADYAEAQAYYEQSLAIDQATGNRRFESYTLGNLGLLATNLGNYAAALAYHEQSLTISREIGDRAAEGRTLNNLGEVAFETGDYVGAADNFKQSLAISQIVGNRVSETVVLHNLGEVALVQADYAGARAHFEQALTIARTLNARQQEANALAGLGNSAVAEGQWEEAVAYYQLALTLYQELGQTARAVQVVKSLALISAEPKKNSAAAVQAQGILDHLAPELRAEYEREANRRTAS
ncbi:MAG: tetratricopeptide repeat protein [Anaerolineaceae bacterium]|nr:tetratricopeptide repeat protein [Anaerolineaceae bacterium]